MKLFKCTVCGYVHEGETAPEVCPKCKVGADKFEELSEEDAIHMEVITLAEKMIALCKEGIEDNLDPKCVSAFTQAKDEAWVIKQRSKTELAGHMKLGKY